MARKFLLVDAHNMIFSDPGLSELHRRNPAAARERLIHLLERHQDSSDTRVVVVFDRGNAARASGEPDAPSGVQVIYAQAGQSADTVIERLVLKYAATHALTVATNDHLVRTAAAAAGAAAIDSEILRDEIERSAGELDETLARLRRRK